MPPFRTEVGDFEETTRALRAIKIELAALSASQVASLDDLVDRPGGAAGTLGGELLVRDRYGKFVVLKRADVDGKSLVRDSTKTERVKWANVQHETRIPLMAPGVIVAF